MSEQFYRSVHNGLCLSANVIASIRSARTYSVSVAVCRGYISFEFCI